MSTLPYIFMIGMMAGFAIAAPVGPVAVLCIKRTLQGGWVAGFIAGAGAALADTFYGAIAAFGLKLISNFLHAHNLAITIIGGFVLMFIGYRLLHSPEMLEEEKDYTNVRHTPFRDFVSTFMITVTNPGTLFAFFAVFAGLGLTAYKTNMQASSMTAGVFVGAFLWWFGLSYLISHFGHRVSDTFLQKINRRAGYAIIGCGLLAFLSLLV